MSEKSWKDRVRDSIGVDGLREHLESVNDASMPSVALAVRSLKRIVEQGVTEPKMQINQLVHGIGNLIIERGHQLHFDINDADSGVENLFIELPITDKWEAHIRIVVPAEAVPLSSFNTAQELSVTLFPEFENDDVTDLFNSTSPQAVFTNHNDRMWYYNRQVSGLQLENDGEVIDFLSDIKQSLSPQVS